MRFEDYTKPQQNAIISKGTNIIVSAGAGSGKTQVLTERVVHFIQNENYKLSEFLILTFTNLAAGEMKERIRKALTERNLSEANEVDNADISTFDSYAYSLVKKYHLMLNLSQNVSIVDSNIISVRKRTILEDIFEEHYKLLDEEFVNLINRFCFKDDENLKDLVLKFYDEALLQIDFNDYINNYLSNYYSNDKIDFYKDTLLQILIEKRNCFFEKSKVFPDIEISKKDKRLYSDVALDQLNLFFNAKDYETLVSSLDNADLPNIPKGIEEEIKEENKKFKEDLRKLKKFFEKLPHTDEEFKSYFEEFIPFVKVILSLTLELDKRIKKFKDLHQAYEFNDIAKMALNLVKDNPDIRDSIKNKLKMIMIDEYQDTSILQETFISYIENNNVYMVGDVKQSIYRFRNARSDIFIDKYNNYKLGINGKAIDLNKNFRSRREVLDNINYIFKQIMTPKYGGADYIKEHLIEYGNKDYLKASNDQNNNLDFIFYEPCSSDLVAEKEAHLIARDIVNKINNHYKVMGYDNNKKPYLRDCKFSDFCILMDRGSSFDTYSRVFNEYQLPLFVENDEDISSNDIVLVLTNILKLLRSVLSNDFVSKDFLQAFCSVARSFIFSYSDEKIFNILKNKTCHLDEITSSIIKIVLENAQSSIYDLFEKIVFEFDIYHKSILIGNVYKVEKYLDTFLTMFKSMSSLDYTIDDFIIYMQHVNEYELKITLSSSSSSVDSVRIMNIHKSKGLEFNIVYFSGLNKAFNRRELNDSLSVSSTYGLVLSPKQKDNVNIIKELNKNKELEEDTSEKIRLFYVALTRAREKMIFLIPRAQEESEKRSRIIFNELINAYNASKFDYNSLIKYFDFFNISIEQETLELIKCKQEFERNKINGLFNNLDKESFFNKIKTYDNDDMINLISIYLGCMPVKEELKCLIYQLYYEELTYDSLITISENMGLTFKPKYLSLFQAIKSLDKEAMSEFIINDLNSCYVIKNQYIDNLSIERKNHYAFFEALLKSLKQDALSLDVFTRIIASFNYELKIDFVKMLQEQNINFDNLNIEDMITKKGDIYHDLKDKKSFLSFLDFETIINCDTFNYRNIDLEDDISLNIKGDNLTHSSLKFKDIAIDSKPIKNLRASKELNLNVNKKAMEFGEKIHFTMELIDFKNPDYSLLHSEYFSNIVKCFLESELMKNVKLGNVYKEYEYYDEQENVHGIIDLMVIYDSHIDIIDYKTKNIENEAYFKQVKIYKNYIEKRFNKHVDTYLYSLLDGTCIKCNN